MIVVPRGRARRRGGAPSVVVALCLAAAASAQPAPETCSSAPPADVAAVVAAIFSGSGTGTFSGTDILTTTQGAFDTDSVTVQAVLNVNWTGDQLDVTVPGPRQIDLEAGRNAAGARRQQEHTIGKQHRLVNAVGYKNNRADFVA